jgi:CDP-paratose 2-epimerase
MSTTLITGGAGFVGCNTADRLLRQGRRVRILDNLSRAGVGGNLAWLIDRHGSLVEFELGDVRDPGCVHRAMRGIDQVFHFAAQVAVTTSLDRPRDDLDVNVIGTVNLLEEARAMSSPPSLVFTSTNKVYGALEDVELSELEQRYEPADERLRHGINERRPLQFCTPYGCSKGAADQYVLDWAHSYGVPAVVMRMSCIYGPRQFGTEDQGWVAHFLIQALAHEPITIYGDGKQVRDILFVGDLVDALTGVQQHARQLSGRAFNVGGGPANAVSLRELVEQIDDITGLRPQLRHRPWRAGDQRYYVTDHRRVSEALDWHPRVGVRDGLRRLYDWLLGERQVESQVAA